jgi:prepilin-type processing-associated H-X9-DG protein
MRRVNNTRSSVARHGTAFTIVELLVVTAILLVLMALLFPSLRNARERSLSVICANNLRQIHQICVLYANDYNGYFLAGRHRATASPCTEYCFDGAMQCYQTGRGPGTWHITFARYAGYEIADCLASSEYVGHLANVRPLWCGKYPAAYYSFGSTSYQTTSLGPNCAWTTRSQDIGGFEGLAKLLGQNLRKLVLAGDCGPDEPTGPVMTGISHSYSGSSGNACRIDRTGDPSFRHGSRYKSQADGVSPYPYFINAGANRGDGRANIVFADGRVESFSPQEWLDAWTQTNLIFRPL